MSLGAGEIEAVVRELAPLAGARVDAVRVHAERALTLELFGPRRPRAPPPLRRARRHPPPRRARARRRSPTPRFPSRPLLRRELEGARVAAIESLPGDRVVALALEAPRGAAPPRRRADGPPREPLPARRRRDHPGERGPEPLAAAQARRRASPTSRPTPPPCAAPGAAALHARSPPPRFPLSAAIEARYAALEAERLVAEGRRRLREPVRAGVARASRALEKLSDEAARVPAAEADRRAADLLKANLRAVKRGAREVTLTEWTEEGPREVRVALDPALTPQANMERFYRRYRRIADSAARVAARTAEVRDREAALRALLAEIDAAPLEELPRLEREARRLGAGPRPQAQPRPGGAPLARGHARRRFRTDRSAPLAGAAILVGRGAAENDRLTLRVARGNDLWLHARGVPGAHVVVRAREGAGPGPGHAARRGAPRGALLRRARRAAGGRRVHAREVRPQAEGRRRPARSRTARRRCCSSGRSPHASIGCSPRRRRPRRSRVIPRRALDGRRERASRTMPCSLARSIRARRRADRAP